MDFGRVAPVVKEQIDAGKVNLTAIMNTHQLARLNPVGQESRLYT